MIPPYLRGLAYLLPHRAEPRLTRSRHTRHVGCGTTAHDGACLALAMKDNGKGTISFVDPSVVSRSRASIPPIHSYKVGTGSVFIG